MVAMKNKDPLILGEVVVITNKKPTKIGSLFGLEYTIKIPT